MGVLDKLWPRNPEALRQRAVARATPGPLHDFLSAPLPAPTTPVPDLDLLAIDLETTGLDPTNDRILSIGFVPVDGTTIRLAGARHLLVRQRADVGDSVTLHGLTDDQLSTGLDLDEALTLTLEALRGRVLLAHFTTVETGFLQRACEQVFGGAPVLCEVDTMHLQYRLLTAGFNDEPPRGALRLWAARQRYGLPTYKAHEALTDALACAELYLALVAEPGTGTTLAELQR